MTASVTTRWLTVAVSVLASTAVLPTSGSAG